MNVGIFYKCQKATATVVWSMVVDFTITVLLW